MLLPPAPVSSTPAKPSLATLEVQKAGATAPFGFFDPLGLSEGKSVKELKKWRESELKHGRVAMLATVGVIVQEVFSPFYSPETGSADPGPAAFHFQKLEAVNPFVLGYIAVLVAVLEAFTISKGWDSKGEYGTRSTDPHTPSLPSPLRVSCVCVLTCDGVGGSDIAGLKDEYLTGDFAFDPLNLAPKKDQEKFLSQRSKVTSSHPHIQYATGGITE